MRMRWMAFVLAVWLGGMPLTAIAEYLPNSALIDQIAHEYSTPQAIAAYLQKEFTFTHDEDLFGRVEYWQDPLEFLGRKSGDCEDYALLARELLRRNGIDAHVFSLFGQEDYAHTVCIFRDRRGRYNIINQDKLKIYRSKSLEALASRMYPAWTFGGITVREGTTPRLVQEITNPYPVSAWDFDEYASFQF